jgi:leader peptidase (prepilin peptidase)/N-methyltransferase
VLAVHLASVGALIALRGIALSFVVGGVVAVVLVLSGRATRSSTFAFGPYLIVATFAVVLIPTFGR